MDQRLGLGLGIGLGVGALVGVGAMVGAQWYVQRHISGSSGEAGRARKEADAAMDGGVPLSGLHRNALSCGSIHEHQATEEVFGEDGVLSPDVLEMTRERLLATPSTPRATAGVAQGVTSPIVHLSRGTRTNPDTPPILRATRREMQEDVPPVHKVVLTGAPCGGKTSSLAVLTKHFESLGFRVYSVPEVATLLFGGGIRGTDLQSDENVYQFQDTLIKMLMALEDGFYSMAVASGHKSIIFCDRGTMDARAYMPDTLWQAMLDANGWTNISVRDQRYDCVVHLVTAAIGAEEHYITGEGTPRTETPREATELDHKIRQGWMGHPYLVVVDNSYSTFAEKLERVVDVVSKRLAGKVESTYNKRKFLIPEMPADSVFRDNGVKWEDFDVTTDFLQHGPDGGRWAIRKRGQYGSYTYTLITKDKRGVETRYTLTGREYVQLFAKRDPSRIPIHQKRRYFMADDGSVFHIDTFINPKSVREIVFLQGYFREDHGEIDVMPSWIPIIEEVTKDSRYTMSNYSYAPHAIFDLVDEINAFRSDGGAPAPASE